MSQTVFNFAIEYQAVIMADRNDVKIAKGQIALLAALLAASDDLGSLDDATADLNERFEDDGKWRGQICLGLAKDGLIVQAGAVNSRRLSRHAGLLRRWRLVDPVNAKKRIEKLKRFVESFENPSTAATADGPESASSKATENESLPKSKEAGGENDEA